MRVFREYQRGWFSTQQFAKAACAVIAMAGVARPLVRPCGIGGATVILSLNFESQRATIAGSVLGASIVEILYG
jgi:hypothetical protein